jgi:peptidyl-dipeptidase Dcp
MLKKIFVIISAVLIFFMCSKDENPFFSDYDTPYGVPPFDKIREDHFVSAFKEGMLQQREKIEAIIDISEEPNFKNVIELLENSSELLDKVVLVFDNLNSAHTSDGIQKIAREMAPLRSKHKDDIFLNDRLFQKVKAVYEKSDQLNITVEQKAVLEDYYRDFVRGGANLNDEDKNMLREINKELSTLTLQFGENLLKENNRFELIIENQDNLAGLPETIIQAAAETAKEKGYQGKWVFTIDKPSLIPFLTHSEKRDLREKIFKAYINQGNHDDELDNKEIATKIAALRVKKANLLGYKTHADFVLEEQMAKEPENVYDLLFQIWTPALKKAEAEAKLLQGLIDEEGKNFKLEPWDWWYYAEKLRKEKYDLDEERLKQYFQLENVREGVFMVANRLFGIKLEENSAIPVYHPDVKAFEVKEADGTLIGILYADYFPRASKRGGAWMSNYREQSKIDEKRIAPIVTNVFNFPRPTEDTPSLLSLDNVETLFHEFGHGLHGLLSDCHYRKLSGTNVARDFVELPSQIMENWATEPEVLRSYAKHYQTGEPIPEDLIDKIQQTSKFNQGFKTVELLAASFLDMDWHTITDTSLQDPIAFEYQSMNKINLISEIVVRYRTPYFRHIFAGGYSAGYYSYIWAEVLDADAFQAFKDTNLFNQKYASAYRENILEKGGTEDPMILYTRFRGAEPNIEPLLENRGLNE